MKKMSNCHRESSLSPAPSARESGKLLGGSPRESTKENGGKGEGVTAPSLLLPRGSSTRFFKAFYRSSAF